LSEYGGRLRVAYLQILLKRSFLSGSSVPSITAIAQSETGHNMSANESLKPTEGPAVNLRMAIEDIVKDI
jgi:hypothetical protein